MNATSQQAINAYAKMDDMAAMVASPHKLVLMLFEAAVKSVAKARMAMQKKQIKAKCDAIDRAISIIQDGLQLSLDTKNGGELAENLNALYEYMCIQLALANARNDLTKLDEVGRMLMDFKKSWEQIDPSAQQASTAQPVKSIPSATAVNNSAPVVAKPIPEVAKKGTQPNVDIAQATVKQVSKPQAPAQPKKVVEPTPVVTSPVNETVNIVPSAAINKMLKGYAPVADMEPSKPMNYKA